MSFSSEDASGQREGTTPSKPRGACELIHRPPGIHIQNVEEPGAFAPTSAVCKYTTWLQRATGIVVVGLEKTPHLPLQSGGNGRVLLCPSGAYQNLLFWNLFYSCSVQFLPLLPFFSSHFSSTHQSLLGPVLSSPGTCILQPHAPRITQLWRKKWRAFFARVIL